MNDLGSFLDTLVNDPRHSPHRGWHEPNGNNTHSAFSQIRDEFIEFVSKLNQRSRCLQIGLGQGPSHFVFANLFAQAWTIEIQSYANTSKFGSGVIFGDSHNPAIKQQCSTFAPFDLLFIDGDKSHQGLRADYYDYAPLVGKGGVIAFHDVIAYPDNQSTITAYNFIEELKASGVPFQTIGSVLGIAWTYM